MAKTIKVIDLLNKIVNGEIVPEKIKWHREEYKFKEERNDYVDACDCSLLYRMTNAHVGLDILDNYVEVIEEQQDIDIQEIEEINDNNCNIEVMTADEVDEYNHSTRRLINQLVQAVKQLDRNIKDKE